MTTTPPVLQEVFERWEAAGRPEARPSSWQRDRWACPGLTLPAGLDDAPVSRNLATQWAARVTGDDRRSQLDAFLIAMVWGYGPVPYGPYRTQRVVEQPRFADALAEVTQVALDDGGPAAYRHVYERRFGDGGSLDFFKYLGPAFGTKYLYFLTRASSTTPVSPVLDEVVRCWFSVHAPDVDVHVGHRWEWPSRYETYVATLHEWAEQLGSGGAPVAADDVEHLIFAHQGSLTGGTWQETWLPTTQPMDADLLLRMLEERARADGVGERAAQPLALLHQLFEQAAEHE